jgi:tRNA1(Val) A37 N6-methylase TrmN6
MPEILQPCLELSDRPGVTDDAVLGGRLRLLQPRRGHRVGHDAILLAAASHVPAGGLAVDLGAGVGAAGLALAVRVPAARIGLVEIDPVVAELAAANIVRNGFADRARVHVLDVEGEPQAFAAAGLADGCAGAVLMNPPFNAPGRFMASPDASRRAAHIGGPERLVLWLATAARLLPPGGVLTLIHRADATSDVLAGLASDFGAVAVLPVAARPGVPAIRIIVRAVKAAPSGLTQRPVLLLQDADGRPSAAVEDVLRRAKALSLGSAS